MSGIDPWLERLAWIALISLPFLAIWGGRLAWQGLQAALQQSDAAFEETQTARLFKILNHIAEQDVRDARHVVMTKIRLQEEEGKNWWESDDNLHSAAAKLCASYDDVAGVINFDESDRVGQYFLETWGEDLIRAHTILQRFLDFRQKSGGDTYKEFTWLFDEAKLIQQSSRPPKT